MAAGPTQPNAIGVMQVVLPDDCPLARGPRTLGQPKALVSFVAGRHSYGSGLSGRTAVTGIHVLIASSDNHMKPRLSDCSHSLIKLQLNVACGRTTQQVVSKFSVRAQTVLLLTLQHDATDSAT